MVSSTPVQFNNYFGAIFDSEKDLDEDNLFIKSFQAEKLIKKMNEDQTFGFLCINKRKEYSVPSWTTDPTFYRNGVWDRFTFYRGDRIKELYDKVTETVFKLQDDMQSLYDKLVNMETPFQDLRDRQLRLVHASEVIDNYKKAYGVSVLEQKKFVDKLPPWTKILYKIIDWCLSRFSEASSLIKPTITMEKPCFLLKFIDLGEKELKDNQVVEVTGSVDFQTCATKVKLVSKEVKDQFDNAGKDKPTLTLHHAWMQGDKVWMESLRTDDRIDELSEPHLRGEITFANTAEEDYLKLIALEIFDREKENKMVLKMPNNEEPEYSKLEVGYLPPEKTELFQTTDSNPILPRFFHSDGAVFADKAKDSNRAYGSYLGYRIEKTRIWNIALKEQWNSNN